MTDEKEIWEDADTTAAALPYLTDGNPATRVVAKAMVNHVPRVSAEIATRAVIAGDLARQRIEDVRANRRNRNRSYTLLVALLFTFLVPYMVADVFQIPGLLKYATGIAIIPDTFITLFAWYRHY